MPASRDPHKYSPEIYAAWETARQRAQFSITLPTKTQAQRLRASLNNFRRAAESAGWPQARFYRDFEVVIREQDTRPPTWTVLIRFREAGEEPAAIREALRASGIPDPRAYVMNLEIARDAKAQTTPQSDLIEAAPVAADMKTGDKLF